MRKRGIKKKKEKKAGERRRKGERKKEKELVQREKNTLTVLKTYPLLL